MSYHVWHLLFHYILSFELLSFTIIGLLGNGYFCSDKCIHSITKSHEVSLNNDGLVGRVVGTADVAPTFIDLGIQRREERDAKTLPCKYLIAVVINVKKRKQQVLCEWKWRLSCS